MIGASAGYMKDGNKNRLRAKDIHKIVDVFIKRSETTKYARMVGFEEIEKNEFNLNLPRYIDSQEPEEDLQDIEGHLLGGIPMADVDALQAYWAVCPNLKTALFKQNRPGFLDLAVDKAAIKTNIYGHPEFATFITSMNKHFDDWKLRSANTLKALQTGCHPKQIIETLSEDLLAHYTNKALIDKYDVYQHQMDYWAETMQDDCYLIAADGWKAQTYRIIEKDKKGKEKDKGWSCDLIPKNLVVERYFAKEQQAIEQMANELEEEHGGEDGVLSDLDKINKATVVAALNDIKTAVKKAAQSSDSSTYSKPLTVPEAPASYDVTLSDEQVLQAWLTLNATETELKKQLKEAEAELDGKAYNQYPKLTETDIKTLVVDDKWLAELDKRIHGEMDRISQQLTQPAG